MTSISTPDMSSINTMPSKSINLSNTQLTILPTLYDNLLNLNCSYNMLTKLHVLPANLRVLNCSYNKLIELPEVLPVKLRSLNCSYNNLTVIPTLGYFMTRLLCSDNQLTELPTIIQLGNGIEWLDCSDNQLTSIANAQYVQNITYLCCANNMITELPNELEESGLCELYCYNNRLTKLPLLPKTLEVIHCQNNQLTQLPCIYFTNLVTVDCSHNKLIELPLCNNIETFNASHNQITHINKLSKNICWSLGNNPIYLGYLLQNPHLMGFKDIHSLHLVEKHPFRKRIPVTFNIRQYIESFFWHEGVDINPPPSPQIIMTLDYQSHINKRHVHKLIKWLAQVNVKNAQPFVKLLKTAYMLQHILHVHPNIKLDKFQLTGMCAAYYGGIFDAFSSHNDRLAYMNYICASSYTFTEIDDYLKKMKEVCEAALYIPLLKNYVWDKDVWTINQWIKHITATIMMMIIM